MTPFWQDITIAIISALGAGGFVSLVQFFVTRHDKAKEDGLMAAYTGGEIRK
jgi:hypothetical protein